MGAPQTHQSAHPATRDRGINHLMGPKRAAQGAAVVAVLALFVVLVVKVVSHGHSNKVHVVTDAQSTLLAPALSLPRLDRPGTLSLASFRGEPVVVNFWASWCGPCADEAPYLEKFWQTNRAKGLEIIGVDANDYAGDARAFARKHGLTYAIIHDAHGSTLGHWGVGGLPATFVIDRRGRVVARILGGLRTGGKDKVFERAVERVLGSPS
jgi:cytochrome c biogenesis protein CcmG, thiol:disulfide interchange protein DsbE